MFLPCLESLPQFPSGRAGPLPHLRGRGPAGGLTGSERAQWLAGVPSGSGAQGGDSWEGPEVPQTWMKPQQRSTLPFPLQRTQLPRDSHLLLISPLAWAPRGIWISQTRCILGIIPRWPDLQALRSGCWAVLVRTPGGGWRLSLSLHLLRVVSRELQIQNLRILLPLGAERLFDGFLVT